MTLRLGLLGTYAQTQHDDRDEIVGPDGESGGVIDLVHDQDLRLSEARLSLDTAITDRFGLSITMPLRRITTQIRYLDEDGREVQLLRAGIHHRNETVQGIGDPMLLGTARFAAGAWTVSGRAGITVPIGRTEENPFALGDQGLAHQHIQLGTGTITPVLGAEGARRWNNWRFGAFALTQQAFTENGKGYRAGDRYAGGAVASRALGEKWSARGSLEVQGETAEHWSGTSSLPSHPDDGNRGRFDLIAGAAASWAMSEHLGLELAVKVPVVTHVVGGQLKMPAIVELGVAWTFGRDLARAETDEHGDHDHGDHDHGDHAPRAPVAMPRDPRLDTTGLDVAELGPAGTAAPLTAAPGKELTIVDFWAPWCEPCRLLEPELLALVRAYPDRLALRRLDIVDWDSAAVARYITPTGSGIPHVKVLDESGAIILERTTDRRGPAPLVEAIRALLERPTQPVP